MSLSPSLAQHESHKVLVCAAAIFVACAGSLTLFTNSKEVHFHTSSLTSTRSHVPVTQVPMGTIQTAMPRFAPVQHVEEVDSSLYSQPEAFSLMDAEEHPLTPMRSVGIAALCMSFVLAVAGLGFRVMSLLRLRPSNGLRFMEMVDQYNTITVLAGAGKKPSQSIPDSKIVREGRVKKAKKGPRPLREKEEKKKYVPDLTTAQVFKKMRQGALKKLQQFKVKPKTTGRVCMLLGKKDNWKARSISFSHIRNKRIQHVNLHWRRMWWEEGKCFVMLRLSTKGIKTITKYGLHTAAIKFGLDLTKHVNGTSFRNYIKYLPEAEKKKALLSGGWLRKRHLARQQAFEEAFATSAPVPVEVVTPVEEPAVIAMMISHGVKKDRLHRPADQRKALLRSLSTELIRHGRIKTTMARAKAMRKPVDHIITLAKNGSLHARRQAIGYIYDKNLVHSLFEKATERYGARNGGYTRIFKTLPRKGDSAKMAIIELV